MKVLRLIAGSGRSGTTWVLDAVAAVNGMRPVFEPLNPYVSRIGQLYAHRALDAGDSHPELKQFLDEVSEGHRAQFWTKYRRQWRWLLPRRAELRLSSKGPNVLHRWARFVREAPELARMSVRRDPLVKCIWSNLLLGWLIKQYDCHILFLVRHPGSVIESELRNDWNASFAVDRFRKDPGFDELTGGRYRDLLSRELSPVENLAVHWLIENQWNIEQPSQSGMTVVHYENLTLSPKMAWQHVCNALDVQNVPDARTLSKPSQQSAPRGSAAALGAEKKPRWLASLSSEQLGRIQAILDAGKFNLYSMDAAFPKNNCASGPEGMAKGLFR